MVWLLRLLSNWADRLARFLLVPIGIGFILVVFLGVLTRYVFQAPIITSVELAKFVIRPLSLEEMQQRVIVVDQANFTVLNFTSAVRTLSSQVAKVAAAGTALASGAW